MLPYIENILQTLTGKSSFSNISEDELRQMADKYPYFGAAQFLFSKKLYQQKTENAEAAMQKAALHFTDVLWLHYNLLGEDDRAEITKISAEEEQEIMQPDEMQMADAEEKEIADDKTPTVQEILAEAEVVLMQEESAAKEHVQENYAVEKEIESEEEIDFNDLSKTTSETENTELRDELEVEPNEKISNLLKEQAEAFEKPVEEAALPVETTPYHRIDYFESQGIKLDEEKANDKLGAQLKRFTDWLKQMKRINPNLANLETDAAGESQVQNMAEHSNQPKEIVTEAMAEVLVKQGKPDQAIQIYEKLSFFNPSKSAYFAAKIQELKP
jgi:hypothetical protein